MIPVHWLGLLQRLFVVPAYTEAQRNIPFGRVNHNKYMVTDKTAYIGLYKFVCSLLIIIIIEREIRQFIVHTLSKLDNI